jgi:Holliday junction resolvase RusA-like endonuclease
MPIRVKSFVYYFRCPKSAKAPVVRYIKDGGEVPYMGVADITDNMNKGVVDVCKGVVFEDDSQIWHVCGIKKLYGLTDHILLEFEETPDVVLINGKRGSSLSDDQDEIQDDTCSLI